MRKLNFATIVLAAVIGINPPMTAAPASSTKSSSQAGLQKETKISMKKARSIALKKAPGKVASEELERENGKLIYSFDINTSKGVTEVNVDAISGKVVAIQEESPAKEAAEKKQEAKEKKSLASPTKHWGNS